MEINPEMIERFGSWIKDLAEWSAVNKRDIVLIEDTKQITLVGSDTPPEEERVRVMTMVPSEYNVNFMESVHLGTLEKITSLAMSCMALPDPPQVEDHVVKINLNAMPLLENVPTLWEKIGEILQGDAYVRRYELYLNGKCMVAQSCEEPESAVPDPVEQVKTTLQSTVTVEDFLRSNLFNGGAN